MEAKDLQEAINLFRSTKIQMLDSTVKPSVSTDISVNAQQNLEALQSSMSGIFANSEIRKSIVSNANFNQGEKDDK
jgi:hypothetical protein